MQGRAIRGVGVEYTYEDVVRDGGSGIVVVAVVGDAAIANRLGRRKVAVVEKGVTRHGAR